MITIQLIDGQPRLVLGCDTCGHPFEHHDEAVVTFKESGGAGFMMHHDCHDEPKLDHWPSIHLDVALVRLASDLGVTAEEAAETASRHGLTVG